MVFNYFKDLKALLRHLKEYEQPLTRKKMRSYMMTSLYGRETTTRKSYVNIQFID